MFYRENVVDSIEDQDITEEYIDNLPVGATLDFLIGKRCGMFHEHIIISSTKDPIIDDMLKHAHPKAKHKVLINLETLLTHHNEFFINYEYGTVYTMDDWIPSIIFLETMCLDFGIDFMTFYQDGGREVSATLDALNVRDSYRTNNSSNTYFRAVGKSYSEAMCKCILKYFYDLGWN